ncbi:MAG: PAS-domain containing protein [Halieaceae bacterium]|nr:PAS-domain containing protein [Halieaceae bacterium]
MFSPSNLLSLALLYVCLLFAVAWLADQRAGAGIRSVAPPWRGWVYALSITVYCSSWTFYGAVGSATEQAWSHAPIYLGPILVFTLCWPVVRRLLAVGRRHRVTSIADYISARYGKRQSLAVIVTLVAAAAVLPYIALQFKALAQAWVSIGGGEVTAVGGDTALLTALVLAVFTILFGARRLDGRERHRGLMQAIAVESLVKLLAFLAVAVLAVAYLADISPEQRPTLLPALDIELLTSADFLAQTLISALAVLCLPRQFHAMVVEGQDGADVSRARWLFPLYLLVFMVLVAPVSQAGAHLFASGGENPDTYVQLLPIALDAGWIAMAAFIGGISAATGMVIVATVALAIMVTNEIAAPLLMRASAGSPGAVLKFGDSLRRVRQLTIAGIMFAAWLVARWIMEIPWLTQIGFICFLAAAQLAPALLAGLYWRRAHGRAVLIGLTLGIVTWFYTAVLPAVLPPGSPALATGLLGIDWLRPAFLPGASGEAPLAFAVVSSLGMNLLAVVLFSLLLKPSAADTRQARLFIETEGERASDEDFSLSLIRVNQLQALLPPFVDEAELRTMWRAFEDRYQQRLLPADRAPQFVVERVEAVLAAVIGATSAQKAMEQLEQAQQLAYTDLAGMVSDASKLSSFNRELLQTTVESLLQGVSVVDSELRLVAWNRRYEQLFEYPPRFLYVGCPIERVYRFNAQRGILGNSGATQDEEIDKRLAWLREGSPHRLERTLPNGKVIDIRGTPMPNGGFVSTYIDITDYRDVVAQLEEAKQELEQKVASGSRSLSETNAALRRENRLRAQVEAQLREAGQSKSRFMSATSHDLLQPVNAARLFTSVLQRRLGEDADEEIAATVAQIDGSLQRAEQLISELREIARLDSGREIARPSDFAAGTLLDELQAEFAPLALGQGISLRIVRSSLWLRTDRSLLYRILQNLLGNALNYTESGRVLLGLRRREDAAELQVLDTGPGIAEGDQARIFHEFERLPRQNGDAEEGLGLGLAIVKRYADLLELAVELKSVPGRGTAFSVRVPLGREQTMPASAPDAALQTLTGLYVVCLDNDSRIRQGMGALLSSMGAEVAAVSSGWELRQLLQGGARPALILADYHLDEGETGIDAVQTAQRDYGNQAPCIIISADNSAELRDRARAAGFRFLPKPVQPARLQALAAALVTRPAA